MANVDGSNGVRDVEVVAKAKRRRFAKEYKLKVLIEVEAVADVGGINAILRREGLYSSHLTQWRKERARGELTGRVPGRKPGRPPNANKPLVDENTKLARRVAQLEKKLAHAEAIIEIQKKVALLMGETLPTIEDDGSDS
jgi:transposase